MDIIDYLKMMSSGSKLVLDRVQRPRTQKDSMEIILNSDELRNSIDNFVKNNDINLIYGITMTLKDEPNNPEFINDQINDEIMIYIKKYNKNLRLILVPEFGTRNGRLHYHGIISDYKKNVINFKNWWKRKRGLIRMEWRFTNINSWKEYIVKDYKVTGLKYIKHI